MLVIASTLLLCAAKTTKAMEPLRESQDSFGLPLTELYTTERGHKKNIAAPFDKKNIFFKSVVTIKVGQNRNQDRFGHAGYRSLLEDAYATPYDHGNGGLLHPVLKTYKTKIQSIEGDGWIGTRATVSGHIMTDGINKQSSNSCSVFLRKNPSIEYKMSKLEAAILAYLKEDSLDRTVVPPHDDPETFSERFFACIKNEWTSKRNDLDTGIRTPEESRLIKQHMTNVISTTRGDMRSGEYMRQVYLGGDNDPFASIELNEFAISLGRPCTTAIAPTEGT